MDVSISVKNKRLKPYEEIHIEVMIENNTSSEIVIPPNFGYKPWFNGKSAEGTSGKESVQKYNSSNTLKPSEIIFYNFKQQLELCYIPKKEDITSFNFKVNFRIGNTVDVIKYPHTKKDIMLDFNGFSIIDDFVTGFEEELEVDFANYKNLLSEENTHSNYYTSGNTIFYYSPYSRGYEKAITILKGTSKDYRILDKKYAINSKSVYRDGRLVKGVNSKGFKVYNNLFAGNEEIIVTSYGNAKVENPKAFRVLDNGLEASDFTCDINGYKGGYATDEIFVYYFDESTITKHATKLKACKSPEKIEVLGYGYAKDDKNVYMGAIKIPKANPETFKLINRGYSTDEKNVFFHRRLIESADLNTFEILPMRVWMNKNPDKFLNSNWARDKNYYYEYGLIKDEKRYEKCFENAEKGLKQRNIIK